MGTLIKRKGLFPSMVRESVNLKETNTNIEVELVAPGMKRKGFKVEIDDNPLMIFSEEKEEVRKEDNYTRRGFNYRSFCRLQDF
jgi:HSP20 family protein